MRATDADPGRLFANLIERLTSAVVDLVLIFVIAIFSIELLPATGMSTTFLTGLALVYLSAFWSSPLSATPAQLLFRQRVVDQSGRRLDAAEIGVARRTRYPDGGCYEMEPNGVIRIRFEKVEELVAGSISITPIVSADGLTWECRVHNGIARGHVPAICRD